MILLNSIFIIIYFTFSAKLFFRFPNHGLIWGYVCFMQCWSLISCYYNDIGVFNPELKEYTYTSYATTWLAILYILFNVGYWYSGTSVKRMDLIRLKGGAIYLSLLFSRVANILLFVFAVYFLLNLLINGIPALDGLDRLEIEKTRGEFENKFLAYFFVFTFLLGLLRRRGRFDCNDAIFVIYIIYFLSIGHKFSGILELFISYLTPVWIRSNIKYNLFRFFKLKLLIAGFFVFVLFFLAVMIHYINTTDSQEEAFNLLVDRIFAMQGHIWWSVQNHVNLHGLYDEQHWLNEVSAVLYPSEVSPNNVGMKYLMINILGYDVASKIIERGYLYTMAYPAILLASFTFPLVAIIQVVMGCIFFNILNKLSYCIQRYYLIRTLLIFTIAVPFISVLGSGVLSVFLTLGVLLKLMLFYLIELADKSRRRI